MEKNLENALKLLKSARGLLRASGPRTVTALYVTPAQQLRDRADEIEYEDELIRQIDEFLR